MMQLVLQGACSAEIARCLAVKLGACIFLGPLISTRSFDHEGRKRGAKKGGFSRWWPSLPMRTHYNNAIGFAGAWPGG